MSATFADAVGLLWSILVLVAAIHVYRNYKTRQSDGKTRSVVDFAFSFLLAGYSALVFASITGMNAYLGFAFGAATFLVFWTIRGRAETWSWVRGSLWILSAVFVVMCASLGGCIYADGRAETRAHAFCSRFAVGGDLNDAIAATRMITDAGRNVHDHDGERTVLVTFMGAPPFSQFLCTIDGIDGKIVRVRYDHWD